MEPARKCVHGFERSIVTYICEFFVTPQHLTNTTEHRNALTGKTKVSGGLVKKAQSECISRPRTR